MELYHTSCGKVVRPQFTDEVIKYQQYSLEEIQSVLDSPVMFSAASRSSICRWRKIYSVLFLMVAQSLSFHTRLSFSICIGKLLQYLDESGDGWLLLLLRTAFSTSFFMLCAKFCTASPEPEEKIEVQLPDEAFPSASGRLEYTFKGG